ncbi:MAG: YajQ family cyclic di-GMP-binding protein [Acidobacteriota bacterium]
MESFDITSGCDPQEVDNAVNQARKEIGQRFDFRGLRIGVEYSRRESEIVLSAPDEYKLRAVLEVLKGRLSRRKVPVKNLKPGPVEAAAAGSVRQSLHLQQGIPTEISKQIIRFVKDRKLKKVQASIQGEQVRISSPSRDSLQDVIRLLKAEEFGLELQFGNYRT